MMCKSTRKCQRKFRREFPGVGVLHRNTIKNFVNKIRTNGMLIYRKPKCCQVLMEEKLDDFGVWLEHSPCKPLRHLAKETGVPNTTTKTATKLLKLRPYKTTVVHSLQLHHPVARLNFCNWYLQSIHNGELNPELTFSQTRFDFN
jgi:hypothetical protein